MAASPDDIECEYTGSVREVADAEDDERPEREPVTGQRPVGNRWRIELVEDADDAQAEQTKEIQMEVCARQVCAEPGNGEPEAERDADDTEHNAEQRSVQSDSVSVRAVKERRIDDGESDDCERFEHCADLKEAACRVADGEQKGGDGTRRQDGPRETRWRRGDEKSGEQARADCKQHEECEPGGEQMCHPRRFGAKQYWQWCLGRYEFVRPDEEIAQRDGDEGVGKPVECGPVLVCAARSGLPAREIVPDGDANREREDENARGPRENTESAEAVEIEDGIEDERGDTENRKREMESHRLRPDEVTFEVRRDQRVRLAEDDEQDEPIQTEDDSRPAAEPCQSEHLRDDQTDGTDEEEPLGPPRDRCTTHRSTLRSLASRFRSRIYSVTPGAGRGVKMSLSVGVPHMFGESLVEDGSVQVRMYGGTVDTDERPFVLIWELTQACELACKHCRAEAEPQRHPEELTTAEGRRLLNQAREFGEGQLLVLSGGDPLAREDAVDLVEYGTDIGLRVTMTPSGTGSLTADRIAALGEAGLRRMAVSLDGASTQSHDEFRQEEGSFEETIAAARAVREAGIPLQINTTVCAETVSELPAIRDLVADLGAVLWSVFFLVPVGRGAVLDPIDPDRAESVMEWLCELQEAVPFGIKTTEAPHYRRVALEQETDSDGGPPGDVIGRQTGITAGDGFAFVSHLGDVYPSGFLPESAGNVRAQSVVDIYRNAPLFEQLREKDALEGKCGACPYRNVCGGSRSRAYAETGNPMASDPLCSFVPEGYEGPLPETLGGTPAD